MQIIYETFTSRTVANYNCQCGFILDVCRKLASDGDFRGIAKNLSDFCVKNPSTKKYIKKSISPIILNWYIKKSSGLTFEEYFQWKKSLPDWDKLIAYNAFSSEKLDDTVNNILNSIRLFRESKKTTKKL